MRRRSWGAYALAAPALLLLLLFVFVVGWHTWGGLVRALSRPPVQAEGAVDQVRDVRAAFRADGLHVPEALAAELQGLFSDLAQGLREGNAPRLENRFDPDRATAQIAATGALPRGLSMRDFARGLREAVTAYLLQPPGVTLWEESQIRNARVLGPDTVVVIARHRHPNGYYLKYRWWVVRSPVGLKFYDCEDLDAAIRFSTITGLGLRSGQVSPQVRQAVSTLNEMFADLGKGDIDTAERKINEVGRVPLPYYLDGSRLLALGMVHHARERFAEALAAFDRAEQCSPDMPLLDLWRGYAFNGLGQWDKALKHLQAYRDLLGEDANVLEALGHALRGLKRFPEAVAAYRKALDDNPKKVQSFLGLLMALSNEEPRDDVPERFARLGDHRAAFLTCAEGCAEIRDFLSIEQIAGAMRKIDRSFSAVDYYEALARAWQGKGQEAATLFKASLALEKDPEQRQRYTTGFLGAMADTEQYLPAYQSAPDASEAFHFLVPHLLRSGRKAGLPALVDAHEKKLPADPLLPLCRAEVHLLRGQFALAEERFAAGLARPPEAPTLELFREGRVLARYRLGKADSAYREIEPRESTFAQLASLMLQDGAFRRLEALLQTHAKTAPGSTALLRYRARLKARQGQVAEATTLFKAVLARPASKEERDLVAAEVIADLMVAGSSLDAYRLAPEPQEVFPSLAQHLAQERDAGTLRQLIEAHRANFPDGEELHAANADLHELEKDWARAAAERLRVWEQTAPAQRDALHGRLVEALYRALAFSNLAETLLGEKKSAELLRLIDEHTRHRPSCPERPRRGPACAPCRSGLAGRAGRGPPPVPAAGAAAGGRPPARTRPGSPLRGSAGRPPAAPAPPPVRPGAAGRPGG